MIARIIYVMGVVLCYAVVFRNNTVCAAELVNQLTSAIASFSLAHGRLLSDDGLLFYCVTI